MREKGVHSSPAVLIVILILIASFGGWYYVTVKNRNSSQTPLSGSDVTQNWNEYNDKQNGYSIKYPANWSIHEFSGGGAGFNPPEKVREEPNGLFGIAVGQRDFNELQTPFVDYIQKAAGLEIQGYQKLISYEKIVTDSSIVGYKTIWSVAEIVSPNKTSIITYFERPNKDTSATIQINGASVEMNRDYGDVYDKMIKTFRYTR